MTTPSLYETDFYGWTQEQARLIRSGTLSGLDMENLLEEIEAMGRSEKRGLRSRLAVLLMHLVKWKHQPEQRSKSWRSTIKVQRFAIGKILQENPGLKPSLDAIIAEAWEYALIDVEAETGLEASDFPAQCPWTFAQFMRDDFWPEAVVQGK